MLFDEKCPVLSCMNMLEFLTSSTEVIHESYISFQAVFA